MRFSAALQQIATLRQHAAEPAPPRKPQAARNPAPSSRQPVKPPELPVDLDQRVRLLGEW